MKQKLIIELSEQATKKYLSWGRSMAEASAHANCLPHGLTLQINILPTIVEIAYIKNNDELIELGDVNVRLVKFQQH